MYEAVHAYPDGDSTAARFARTAARYGFDGIVVRARGADPDYDRLRGSPSTDAESADPSRADAGIDVVDAVEIVADDPSGASGPLARARREHTLVVVRGGTPRLNRFAVEQERVDVLARPFAREGDVDHVIARLARENGVRIEFDLGPVLRSDGGPRVRHLRKLRKLRELVDHYESPYVLSANPTSHLQLRAPRELAALCDRVGFPAERATAGLEEWGRLAARNRERASESFIGPGVQAGRYEEDA
ncbi:MAG: RNase P subunit p30 family protein [Salinigranum sp.]